MWRLILAHHCMKAVSINQGATATLMWNAQAQAKPHKMHADCNTHCFKGATENAGVEKAGVTYGTPTRDYIEKALSYFVIRVLILLTE